MYKSSALLNPGGTFRFQDKYYRVGDLEELLHEDYDSGHPIKIDAEVLEQRLADDYEQVYRRVEKVERTKWGMDRPLEFVSFVGKKK